MEIIAHTVIRSWMMDEQLACLNDGLVKGKKDLILDHYCCVFSF